MNQVFADSERLLLAFTVIAYFFIFFDKKILVNRTVLLSCHFSGQALLIIFAWLGYQLDLEQRLLVTNQKRQVLSLKGDWRRPIMPQGDWWSFIRVYRKQLMLHGLIVRFLSCIVIKCFWLSLRGLFFIIWLTNSLSFCWVKLFEVHKILRKVRNSVKAEQTGWMSRLFFGWATKNSFEWRPACIVYSREGRSLNVNC